MIEGPTDDTLRTAEALAEIERASQNLEHPSLQELKAFHEVMVWEAAVLHGVSVDDVRQWPFQRCYDIWERHMEFASEHGFDIAISAARLAGQKRVMDLLTTLDVPQGMSIEDAIAQAYVTQEQLQAAFDVTEEDIARELQGFDRQTSPES